MGNPFDDLPPVDPNYKPCHVKLAEAKEALRGLLDEYISLVNNCVFWDVEKEPCVIAARAVLGDDNAPR